jgi:hypothetical protein
MADYNEDDIKSLDWKEHIRLRPGMYIGKLGDGSAHDDGIYILLKEIVDNSIDEFVMGVGKSVELTIPIIKLLCVILVEVFRWVKLLIVYLKLIPVVSTTPKLFKNQ